MAWRCAKSLETLREQINLAYPGRSKKSDGTIGDSAHASRKSDHNPNRAGVVQAMDITHDPTTGLDAGKLADILRASGDKRIKYIISNNRIANSGQAWRKYTGTNPHTMHFHISVADAPALYDDPSPWPIVSGQAAPVPDTTPPPVAIHKPILQKGSKGDAVKEMQTLIKMPVREIDGYFGPRTLAAVIAFQKSKKMAADGICGPYTWAALRP